jgi:hypothetical protein
MNIRSSIGMPGRGAAALLAGTLVTGVLGFAPQASALSSGNTATTGAASTGKTGPAPLTAAQASARARTTGKAVEVSSLTTETSLTTANPNGSLTLTESAAPVRVRENGAWVGLDATLKANRDGTFSPAATPSDVVLSGGDKGALISLHQGGEGMSLTLPLALPRPVVSGPSATYRNVLPGVDLTVTVRTSGAVSDVFTVHNASAAADPRLAQLLTAHMTTSKGLKLTSDATGNLAVTDASGHAVFTAPVPRAWDSAAASVAAPLATHAAAVGTSGTDAPAYGAHTAALKVTTQAGTLAIAPPNGLFTAKNALFPMFVDPTYSPSYGNNGWSSPGAGYPNDNHWDSTVDPTNGITQIGYSGGPEGEALSLFDFPIDLNTLRGATIYSAYFGIVETHSWACPTGGHDQKVDLYAPGATLSPSNATWNYWSGNLGGSIAQGNFALGYNSNCPAGGIPAFNVTGTVANDVNGGKGTQTLAMRADDHSDNYAFKEFQASSANLTVTYDYTPDTPSGLFTSPATTCAGSTLGDTGVSLYTTVNTRAGGSLTTTFSLTTGSSGNLLTSANGVNSDTYTGGSGQLAVMDLPESFFKAQAKGARTVFNWQAQTSDGTLASGWSSTCSFAWDPTRPGAPTVAPNPNPPSGAKTCATVNDTTDSVQQVGTSCSFTLTPPVGATISGFTYQVDDQPPVTVDATGATNVSVPLARLVNTLTVSALSAGGNLGSSRTAWFDGTTINPPAKDGDLTLDGTPDLIVAGNSTTALPPGLWLATGHGDGTVATGAVNIGINGLGFNTNATPADWNGAQAISGDYCGYGAQDVLAYFPTGVNAGGGAVVCNDGGGDPLHLGTPTTIGTTTAPYSIPAGALVDSNGNVATQVASAGNTSGHGETAPDLFATISNQLYLLWSTTPNGYNTNSTFGDCPQGCSVLSALNSPDGSQDWNSWTIATTQLSSGIAMYLWNRTTGALDLWTGLGLSSDHTTLTFANQYALYTGASGSTWNSGLNLLLRAADISGSGIPDLWATDPTTGVVTAYLPSSLGGQPANTATTTLDTSNHAWLFQDIGTNTSGSALTSTADSVGSLNLTGTTGVQWNTGDLYRPDALLNTQADGTTPSGGTGVLSASGPAVNVASDFTVSVRAKPNALGGVILSQDGSHSSGFILYPDGASRKWMFCLAKTDNTTWNYDCDAGGIVQLGVWAQITASYNASTGIMTLYVNGVETSVATHAALSGFTGPFHVGDFLDNNTRSAPYSGQVADIHTWNAVLPPPQPQSASSEFVPVNPTRVVDTRDGTGGTKGPIANGGVVAAQITGSAGIPTTGVTAAAVSITETAPTSNGFLTVYPDGTPQPVTSTVNFGGGVTVTNGAIVPVGANGKIDLCSCSGASSNVQIIVDVTGYFTSNLSTPNASLFVPTEPNRLIDTRNGTGVAQATIPAGGTLVFQVAGADIDLIPPNGLTAVALNLTVPDAGTGGYLIAYPDGISQPSTTSVTFNSAGETIAATSVVPVGSDGSIDITNKSGAPENVAADTVGYFAAATSGQGGQKYHAIDSTRLVDTRMSGGAVTGAQPFVYNDTAISAVNPTLVLNVTLTQEAGGGIMTIDPGNFTAPTSTSNLNYTSSTDIANLDLALTWNNAFNAYVSGANTQLVVDTNGFFADY